MEIIEYRLVIFFLLRYKVLFRFKATENRFYFLMGNSKILKGIWDRNGVVVVFGNMVCYIKLIGDIGKVSR